MSAEKIKKVFRYRCSDGREFENTVDAQIHQRQIDLAEEKFKPIYGDYDGKVDYGDFTEWAEENKQFLIAFVKLL